MLGEKDDRECGTEKSKEGAGKGEQDVQLKFKKVTFFEFLVEQLSKERVEFNCLNFDWSRNIDLIKIYFFVLISNHLNKF